MFFFILQKSQHTHTHTHALLSWIQENISFSLKDATNYTASHQQEKFSSEPYSDKLLNKMTFFVPFNKLKLSMIFTWLLCSITLSLNVDTNNDSVRAWYLFLHIYHFFMAVFVSSWIGKVDQSRRDVESHPRSRHIISLCIFHLTEA